MQRLSRACMGSIGADTRTSVWDVHERAAVHTLRVHTRHDCSEDRRGDDRRRRSLGGTCVRPRKMGARAPHALAADV